MTAKKYCKKDSSIYNYQFFDNEMQLLSIKHSTLESEIRKAIKNQEWQLYYQPKLDLKKNKIVGIEALIRWNHPERGILSPFEFIGFAEDRGFIIDIGDWVIEESCKQFKLWSDNGIKPCKISINLSSVQLRQEDIVNRIITAMKNYNVPPRLFEVEITETTLTKNFDVSARSLERLNARGVSIAIDDFGVGYSSLSYLKNFPINRLKIDRSFIKDLCYDDSDKKIVQTLISMAHSMDVIVVAEGVETEEQLTLLNQYKCDEIQGYFISKPVPAEKIDGMIKQLESKPIKPPKANPNLRSV
ncbi:MAG: EAL domain-containing protein [Pseudomonadota bacterium]